MPCVRLAPRPLPVLAALGSQLDSTILRPGAQRHSDSLQRYASHLTRHELDSRAQGRPPGTAVASTFVRSGPRGCLRMLDSVCLSLQWCHLCTELPSAGWGSYLEFGRRWALAGLLHPTSRPSRRIVPLVPCRHALLSSGHTTLAALCRHLSLFLRAIDRFCEDQVAVLIDNIDLLRIGLPTRLVVFSVNKKIYPP